MTVRENVQSSWIRRPKHEMAVTSLRLTGNIAKLASPHFEQNALIYGIMRISQLLLFR